jgi:uncharacterized protein (UPF0248 family)
MIFVKDFLNKIKWDPNLKKEEFEIFYEDRILKKMIGIRFKDIKEINDGFILIKKENEEVNIPLHRIKEIKKNGKIVWRK